MGRPNVALNRRAADRVHVASALQALRERVCTSRRSLAQRWRAIACLARHRARIGLSGQSVKGRAQE
jgi:hypothetical protein